MTVQAFLYGYQVNLPQIAQTVGPTAVSRVAEWFDWCKGCLNGKESVAAPLVRKAAKQAMFIGKAPFFVLESRTDKMNRSPLFLHPTRVIMKKTDCKPEE